MKNLNSKLDIQRLANWFHSGNKDEVKKCIEDIKRKTGKSEVEILKLCVERGSECKR